MPDSTDPVTLGEVYRRLSDLERRLDAGFQTVHKQISDATRDFIHVDRYLAERQATGERIATVERDVADIVADTKWLRRTILVAVAGLVINIVVGVVVLLVGSGIG